MATKAKIDKLTKQLYPTGRAFKIPPGGNWEKFHSALNEIESNAFDDALATLDSILPDNDNFTEDDAEAWEIRLGLITDSNVSLADRKLAIKRKMNHPGTIPARQNWEYLQQQIQAAGFTDVYVHENKFSDGMGGFETRTPYELLGESATEIVGLWEHGSFAEHGEIEHGNFESGSVYNDCVANYINYLDDLFFDTGDNLRNTFIVSSAYPEFFADVDANRREELRQLILKVKPVQTVGFLFLNYV